MMDALAVLLCVLLTAKGFEATTVGSLATASCGDYMTEWMGEFFSPQYPNNYPNNARCLWTIHSTGKTTVLLTFTYADLETCCDYIRVFDGPTSLYPLLGELRENRKQSFYSSQNDITVVFYSDSSVTQRGFRANWVFVDSNSCMYNCGNHFSTCSCDSSCQYSRNCCHDYNNYCLVTTSWPDITTTTFSCRYNCGYSLGSCSCESFCQFYGDCCHDFYTYCSVTTPYTETAMTSGLTTAAYSTTAAYQTTVADPTTTAYQTTVADPTTSAYQTTIADPVDLTTADTTTAVDTTTTADVITTTSTTTTADTTTADTTTTADLTTTAGTTATADTTTTADLTTTAGTTTTITITTTADPTTGAGTTTTVDTTTAELTTTADLTTTLYTSDVPYSCEFNCETDFSTCSCNSFCQNHGNCCSDYEFYCPVSTTSQPAITTGNQTQCGGHLNGSGLFTSPNYPNYYHDDSYCVWYLSAEPGQRIFLSFIDVQLERCCNCDYISVHDGPSTDSQQLGMVCFSNTTRQLFHSSSRYLTVVFRSDNTGFNYGFKAVFTSSLTADQGRVDCSSDNMVIVIQTSYLNSLGFNGNDLYVDDHRCRPTISSTEVVFRFPLDTCGTGREMMNGYVTYTNNVRASQSQSGEITRQSQFLLRVGCRMEPDTVVQIFYKARENINANITGTGRFSASMAFYTSSSFTQQIYDSPYEVNLNQIMFVQVKLDKPDSSLDLFLDTCVASPDANDFKTRSYDLLRNGCTRDHTFVSYTNGQQFYARFRFQAFKFLRTHAFVYLQCKVIICPDDDYNSRCRQGCRLRRKRSLQSNHHTSTVTLGPIKLRGQKAAVQQPEKTETAE